MDFVGSAGGGGGGGTSTSGGNGPSLGLGADSGPILYSEPNRTSAVDDIRSVVLYIFIITIFVSFFLILPGIRNEKFPTFLCITTSLIVTSIILISLFGTTWHQADAPISAAYKAFSRDRIQGDLSVKIGLQSVNITLRAQKYYILDASDGPIIMDNTADASADADNTASPDASTRTPANAPAIDHSQASLADELLRGRTADGATVDTELEVDEVFAQPTHQQRHASSMRRSGRSAAIAAHAPSNNTLTSSGRQDAGAKTRAQVAQDASSVASATSQIHKRSTHNNNNNNNNDQSATQADDTSNNQFGQDVASQVSTTGKKYTIKRVNVDINYNERFYWIGPNQMRQEHHNALERGLPYPILTVVEYLSQDDGGFSWSRQYRLAGYYSYICLWLSLCVCILMFVLHCAAPKYGIYTMQILGCMLLFTNITYATLVPRGEQKLVIPFEGQSLTFKFGWNFWIVLIGGCLSLVVGTIIVIIDGLFPNFIFTTVLDVDFDSRHSYYKRRKNANNLHNNIKTINNVLERPIKPPFYDDDAASSMASPNAGSSRLSSARSSSSIASSSTAYTDGHKDEDGNSTNSSILAADKLRHRAFKATTATSSLDEQALAQEANRREASPKFNQLFASRSIKRSPATSVFPKTSDSEADKSPVVVTQNHRSHMDGGKQQKKHHQRGHNESAASSVVDLSMAKPSDTLQQTDTSGHSQHSTALQAKLNHQKQQHHQQHHYGRGHANKNVNLKSTDHHTHRGSMDETSMTISNSATHNVRL